ncbi:hypothetical protein BJ508DRAFT_335111 [Ascobolus immersus RN42]|uniref:Uncharacterized protein n=1 Tax=Ascobolus immersus RN42 TaxID=1160509 RepID=A0A3N4HDM4_ASCIM|nr:hypothetical protein BJ508DRAFT_335111 [Ascobolus immersus RN42]
MFRDISTGSASTILERISVLQTYGPTTTQTIRSGTLTATYDVVNENACGYRSLLRDTAIDDEHPEDTEWDENGKVLRKLSLGYEKQRCIVQGRRYHLVYRTIGHKIYKANVKRFIRRCRFDELCAQRMDISLAAKSTQLSTAFLTKDEIFFNNFAFALWSFFAVEVVLVKVTSEEELSVEKKPMGNLGAVISCAGFHSTRKLPAKITSPPAAWSDGAHILPIRMSDLLTPPSPTPPVVCSTSDACPFAAILASTSYARTSRDRHSDEAGLRLFDLVNELEEIPYSGSFDEIAALITQHFPYARKLLLDEPKTWEELGMCEPTTKFGEVRAYKSPYEGGWDEDELEDELEMDDVRIYSRLTAEYLVCHAIGNGRLRRDKVTMLKRALERCVEVLMRERRFERVNGTEYWTEIGVPDEPVMTFPQIIREQK